MLRLSQHEAKNTRRNEAGVVENEQTNSTVDTRSKDDLLDPVDPNTSMEDYIHLYEKVADSYRSTSICRLMVVGDMLYCPGIITACVYVSASCQLSTQAFSVDVALSTTVTTTDAESNRNW